MIAGYYSTRDSIYRSRKSNYPKKYPTKVPIAHDHENFSIAEFIEAYFTRQTIK